MRPSGFIRERMRASFSAVARVRDDAIEALASRARIRRFAALDWLLRGGEVAECCFLITEGLVREMYLGETGEEHTRSFMAAGQVTGSLLDLLSGAPSVTWIQALEPTSAIS
jgi:CRP-like cAMP-binding protein